LHVSLDYRKGELNFHLALEAIWEVVHAADRFIDSSAPWVLAKEGRTTEIQRVLYQVVETLRNLAILLIPFLPNTSEEMWRQLGLSKKLKWENQKFKDIQWGKTPAVKVTEGKPIFPRIDLSPLTPPLINKERGTGGEVQKETPMELDIAEFQKLDLRIAEVLEAERIPGTDKLLRLQISLGTERRQIVAGIAEHYPPEQLAGKKIVVVANLKPVTIRGVESRGMLLAASDSDGLSILTVDRPRSSGAKVK
jgi:methionyl-tRNA synthetase